MDDVGFYFFPSFNALFEKIEDDSQRLMLFDAIRRYAFMDEMPKDLPFALDLAFTAIRPNIDASMQNQRNGKKGGRPPKASTIEAAVKTPDKNPGKNPPIKQENRIEKERIEGESVFTPPTREEVLAFFREEFPDMTADYAENFFYTYDATKWQKKRGVQIVDWRSQAHTWVNQDRKKAAAEKQQAARRGDTPDWK